MPQEKRKILSPSAGNAQNGARYGTAERSRVSGNGDPRSRGNAPDRSAAQNHGGSPQSGRAPGASGANGKSGAQASRDARGAQNRSTSRSSQNANSPRGARAEQPYSATFHFQKITPEMAAKHRAEQQKTRSGAAGGAGTGSRGVPGSRSGGAESKSGARSTGPNDSRSGSVTRSPARGGTGKNKRGTSLSSSAAPSGAAVIRSRLTARRMPTIRTVQSRVVRRFPLKIILISILCTVLFLLIIYNNVQINEKNSKVDELKSTVVELDSKLSELTLKVEKKNDLREIEQRALELGMVKADELKKVYVSINSADKVELVDDNADEKQSFRMTGLFEQVRSFFTGLFGLDDGSAETGDGSSG